VGWPERLSGGEISLTAIQYSHGKDSATIDVTINLSETTCLSTTQHNGFLKKISDAQKYEHFDKILLIAFFQ
jgi:hypothetical protein